MKLFWLDLETTGLDPYNDAILEIAIRQAEFNDPFDAHPFYSAVLRFDGRELSPFILEMHTANGLLEECSKSDLTPSDIEPLLLQLVPEELNKEDKPVLAGSSIHFDMAFLRAQMPRFASRFSHRLYDVSAVKLFCQSLGAEKFPKAEAHRAIDDINESIAHAHACRMWLEI